MNFLVRPDNKTAMDTLSFLSILTIVQFWWIATWGIAYIVINHISGNSKKIELLLYTIMLIFTVLVMHLNPSILERV